MEIFFKKITLLLFISLLPACNTVARQDRVCFRNHCVNVEIAADEQKRTRGLQARSQLSDNAGMLFIFPESRPHSFWMKDTLIPLDMIWLDASQRIVHIQTSVPPCRKDPCPSYTPTASDRYVLEVNSGKAKTWNLKVGDRMEFRLKKYLSEFSVAP